MALSGSTLLELVIHRDLLLELDSRADLERVIPEEINMVLTELALHFPLIHLPLAVACNSYVDHDCLVFCIYVGCGPDVFNHVGGLEPLRTVLTLNFKLFFAAILGDDSLQYLLEGCVVRIGEDCLVE